MRIFYITLLLVSSVCHAEEAYRWEDANGRVFYGSKPPGNAVKVERIKGHNLSHYDSSKVIKGYRGRIKENLAVEPVVSEPAKISHSKPTCIIENSQLVQCSVSFENLGGSAAENLKAAIEFSDGTIIPLHGPKKLLARAKVLYVAPESLLPLALDVADSEVPSVKVSHD